MVTSIFLEEIRRKRFVDEQKMSDLDHKRPTTVPIAGILSSFFGAGTHKVRADPMLLPGFAATY